MGLKIYQQIGRETAKATLDTAKAMGTKLTLKNRNNAELDLFFQRLDENVEQVDENGILVESFVLEGQIPPQPGFAPPEIDGEHEPINKGDRVTWEGHRLYVNDITNKLNNGFLYRFRAVRDKPLSIGTGA